MYRYVTVEHSLDLHSAVAVSGTSTLTLQPAQSCDLSEELSGSVSKPFRQLASLFEQKVVPSQGFCLRGIAQNRKNIARSHTRTSIPRMRFQFTISVFAQQDPRLRPRGSCYRPCLERKTELPLLPHQPFAGQRWSP
jgi:hypothetical protein